MKAAGVRDAERKRTRCATCSAQPREKLLPCPEHRSRAKAPKKRQPRACETRRGNEHGARLAHRRCGISALPRMGARNWEGQVTGLTSRRKKKEGLLSALFGHGEEERRRPPAHRPERHTGGQNPAAAPFAHRTEGRRVNIDISLDAPERREKTAAPASRTAPAHRTQTKRDVSPRPAVRPQQRTGHDVLPEPYRKYYASVMKKPY